MTDLRARIAAAIKREDDLRVCKLSNADIRFMADAVIAELGLALECSWHVPVSKWVEPLPKKVRYVTEWKADE